MPHLFACLNASPFCVIENNANNVKIKKISCEETYRVICLFEEYFLREVVAWCLAPGVVVITTAQLHSTKPELRFCAGSNPACGASEIRNGEDL